MIIFYFGASVASVVRALRSLSQASYSWRCMSESHLFTGWPPWSSGMSLASGLSSGRSEVSSRRTTWPDLKRGLCGKCDKSTGLKITCLPVLHIHVGKSVSYLLKVSGYLKVHHFLPPVKLTDKIWPQMSKVVLNPNQCRISRIYKIKMYAPERVNATKNK